MSPKAGRPTTNPKDKGRLTMRLDEECTAILNRYCEQEKVDRAEAARRGIRKLKGDIKE